MKDSATDFSPGLPWRRGLESFGAALVVIALTLAYFAPHLGTLMEPSPGTFEWDRALGFLRQCANPWAPDVEAALRWRLLPPTVAYWLGLRGIGALALPWLGVVALLTQLHWMLRRAGLGRAACLATMVLVAGSGGALTSMHWLGINDGWYLMGLVTVTLSRGLRSLVVACLLCVWIDERFIVGLPLALLCRTLTAPDLPNPASFAILFKRLWHVSWPAAAAVLPYALIRVSLSVGDDDLSNGWFLHRVAREFVNWAPYAPLGWWMGLRAAWAPLVTGLRDVSILRGTPAALLCLLTTAATLALSLVLASDLSRTTILLLPGILCGAISLAQSSSGERVLLVAAAANLLIPAMHVSYSHGEPIYYLPLELWRLWN